MRLVSSLAIAVVVATASWPIAGQTTITSGPLARVLQPFVDSQLLAGAVVLVADKEKVLDVEAVGYMDVAAKQPMRTDCLFWIASQSKPITCTALMILVDAGLIKVDDPVEKYLPEFKNQMYIADSGESQLLLKRPGRPMLVRDVMSHTSGLPGSTPLMAPTLDNLPLAKVVAGNAIQPLQTEPGKAYKYSNPGINTVGRLVEVVSGMPFEKFLDERIFKPLGMVDTTFWPSAEQLARLAKPYKPMADQRSLEETTIGALRYPLSDRTRHPFPGGGLFSTAGDLARFYRMMANDGVLDGTRVLSAQAVAQMTTNQTGEAQGAYGFGFGTNRQSFTHGGAYGTNSRFDRDQQLITIYLVQHAGWAPGGKEILTTFQKAATEKFGKSTAASASQSPTGPALVVGIPSDSAATTGATPIPTAQPVSKQNITVFQEPGRYGGWPANHGLWQWGDEMVVGYQVWKYKAAKNDHAVDRDQPYENYQSRSLDGGKSWTVEKSLPFSPMHERQPTPLTEPLDFTSPNFALMFRFGGLHSGPSWFYTTQDRCRTWAGPYSFAVAGIDKICTRTDLIVLGQRDCLMFGSAAKESDGKEGRVFCARTKDGGLTWKLVSLIGPEPERGYAIMPSTVRLASGALITSVRHGGAGVNSISAWRSDDLGVTWNALGMVTGDIGSNPPALVILNDGRLGLTYGFRRRPFGVRARISSDEGRTWGPELVLRDDGLTGDLGYPRSVVRPDGKVFTAYYFNGPRDEDRTIQATLWQP